ncbi:MAG: phenylalanine--tRNA ligase beta subunit-related protein [Spirochaetia bacterium]
MEQTPSLTIDPAMDLVPVRLALIWGFGMPGCPPTVVAPDFLREALDRARAAGTELIPADRKAGVRKMLRFGSYKPAGRSKPSSEYLLAAALAGDFPLVNGPVDVNNAVSLESGYPASIFDAGRSGRELFLRRGKQGESYQFNQSGQAIALEDLMCIWRRTGSDWVPCGNPVKDSMETKVGASTTQVVAVIFSPADEAEADLRAVAARYSSLLSSHCGAVQAGFTIVGR